MNETISCILESKFDISNFISSLAAVSNLVLLIYIYKKEISNNKQKELRNYKSSWVKIIDFEKRVDKINEIIKTTKSEIKLLNEDQETDLKIRKTEGEKKINDFNSKIIEEKIAVTSILKPINQELSKVISNDFNLLIEVHSKLINDSILQTQDINFVELDNQKEAIIYEYYEIGAKILK